MTEAARPAVDFSYDAFGRRYETNNGLVQTCYTYDGPNAVATTFDCSSQFGVTSYLGGLGLDESFMVNDPNTGMHSFLRDALNSTITLTSSSGSIVDQTTYDPYGNTTDSIPSSASPFEFTGRENDGTVGGLYYMRARYYSPQLARFIARDPMGLGGGVNRYAYAGDDPVDFSDPTGTDPWIGGINEYINNTNGGFNGERYYGASYGYGAVELGLGIVLGGIGVGGSGNILFNGSRVRNTDGYPTNGGGLWLVGGTGAVPEYRKAPAAARLPFGVCLGLASPALLPTGIICGIQAANCASTLFGNLEGPAGCGQAVPYCSLTAAIIGGCHALSRGYTAPIPSPDLQ